MSLSSGTPTAATTETSAGTAPLKRAGLPIEIAYGTLYLSSDEASYVTGIGLVIDGGYLAQ